MACDETKQSDLDEEIVDETINGNSTVKEEKMQSEFDTTEEVAENDSTEDEVREDRSDEKNSTENTEGKPTKRRKERKERKSKQEEAIEELNDKVRRQMAEFENFRKRSDKEKGQMYEIGARSIVEKILPIVDNLERGLAAVPEENKDSFVEGMNKVYKQFIQVLEEAGVKPIEAVGNEFDPNLHNAVMHVEDEDIDENVVVEEFQKGYMYHDTVVRHSMVKVAN